jgi:hypothetical protein
VRAIGAILGAALAVASPTLAAPPERPYSCRLLDDAARKCAFGACDQRERDRLTYEKITRSPLFGSRCGCQHLVRPKACKDVYSNLIRLRGWFRVPA